MNQEDKIKELLKEAGSCYDAGKYEDAIGLFHQVLTLDDSDIVAWLGLSAAYAKIGNMYESDDAREEAEIRMAEFKAKKIHETNPLDADSLKSVGDAHFVHDDWFGAIKAYRKYIEIEKDNPQVWFRLGCSFYEVSSYNDALQCFNKALNLDPDDIYAWNDKGATLCALGRHKEALAAFDEALHIRSEGLKDFGHDLIGGNMEKATILLEGEPLHRLGVP